MQPFAAIDRYFISVFLFCQQLFKTFFYPGDKIREARLKQRLSQSDLAAKVQIAGVTLERDSISRIEIGTRFVTDYELKIFAKVLHVNVEWLLEETEE